MSYEDSQFGFYTTMEMLRQIPVSLDLEEIRRRLRIKREKDLEKVKAFVEVAQPLISARAVYGVCYIEARLRDAIIIDGVRFTSKVLRKHLDKVERVFPYVVTIGGQLEQKARGYADLLDKYFFDIIGNVAVVAARKHLEDIFRSKFGLRGISTMSPGSLKDWPIEEQRPLFSILGNVETSIGVKLNQHLFMMPAKSLSGIYFPTEIPFFSCQLCPRQKCPSRKAIYNENLAREYGVIEKP
ncbi:MAG: hypothetical protein PVG99_03385 [Desulfobacteraceae bacterium]